MKKFYLNHLFGIAFTVFLSILVFAIPLWNSGAGQTYQVSEDTFFSWNFTNNISNPEYPMTFTITFLSYTTNSTYTYQNFPAWLAMNQSTGVMTINVTNTSDYGFLNLSVEAKNSSGQGTSDVFFFNITQTNDAPQFLNLENKTFNITELFTYLINVTDEENDVPFTFNITFMNCTVAQWSSRNCSDVAGRELFTTAQYTLNNTEAWINISFTPSRNDVGYYTINFSVSDLNNTVAPFNATRSQIIGFNVTNQNVAPYFRYVCDNERNTSEDSLFNCLINFSDIDEINNITVTANYTFFKFNESVTNSTVIAVNSTTFFNGTAVVNFTPTDSDVGNWSVNVSLTDNSDLPIKTNSTTFYFFVQNVNDSVSAATTYVVFDGVVNQTITPGNNITAYSSNNYTIFLNASDNDLLIPDKSVYNEDLTFTSNNSILSVTSATYMNGNTSQARIFFNPNDFGSSGNYSVNISVRDLSNFSVSSVIITIQTIINNAPEWDSSTAYNNPMNEGTYYFLNFSQNVSDVDGDLINFTFTNDSAFPSFNISKTNGNMSITPVDEDVGYHNVTITATDGKTPSPREFNFTIYNVNDNPSIQTFPSSPSIGASGNQNVGINVSEDNATTLTLWVHDDDFRIPVAQRSFYRENITVNVTIQGPNTNLFNFTQTSDFSTPTTFFGGATPQRTEFDAIFTPNKSDVGNYNVTVNITDFSGVKSSIQFNLTVFEVPHNPVMTPIGNQVVSIFETLYFDINTTDLEDLFERNATYPNSNLTYRIQNLTAGGNFTNETTFNTTTGIFNFTFSQTYAGVWTFNISVNDSSGLMDSEVFNITVYDYPIIITPATSFQFNFKENVTGVMNFSVNHSARDSLNYTLIINGVIRNSTLGNGNATPFYWNFTANFTDETTCLGVLNITLNVSNSKLSNLTTWNVTINHTNYPMNFTTTRIPNLSGGDPRTLNLTNYYYDLDATDGCNDDTIGFRTTLVNATNGTINVNVTNATSGVNPLITFSSSSDASAEYYVTAFEYNSSGYSGGIVSNYSSNNFSVEISTSEVVVPVPTPSSGGGGSSGNSGNNARIVSLRIIVPEPVSVKKKDRILVPVGLINDGEVDLYDITLSASVAKNGILREDLIASFDRSFFDDLLIGDRENLTMIVDIDTRDTGIFEVTINAEVEDPSYNDSAKFYIEITEEEDIIERIVFTEELIINNPECAELREVVDEARVFAEQGNNVEARRKIEEAIEACKLAIAQPLSVRVRKSLAENIFGIIGAASLVAFALGFVFYYYRRIRLREEMFAYQNKIQEGVKEEI